MHLRDSAEDACFRAGLREWLPAAVAALPPKPHVEDWPARKAYDRAWQRSLHEAGYAGINWPAAFGGRGATPTQHLIYLEEAAAARAPEPGCNFVGLLHAGPTLILEGTDEQRARHLPPILSGEHVWCQGFSEPDAGSDLASLRTRADRDGDDYVVTGQKVWTSNALAADYCELLVRTDPDAPKHKGITWLIAPMDAPGITIRPLRTIQGSNEFAEVFLDEVRVPAANRVGDENDGWRVAQVTFSFERGTAFVSEMLDSLNLVRELSAIARRTGLWQDAGLRRDLGILSAELDALWSMTKRTVSEAGRGSLSPAAGSAFKLSYADVRRRLGEAALAVLKRDVLDLDDVEGRPARRHVHGALHSLAVGIAAGTSEIQRNILAERILGLPREGR